MKLLTFLEAAMWGYLSPPLAVAPPLVIALATAIRRRIGRGPRSYPVRGLASACLAAGSSLVFALYRDAHAVRIARGDLSSWRNLVGELGELLGVFSWQQEVRILLALAGLVLSIAALRVEERWSSLVALVVSMLASSHFSTHV